MSFILFEERDVTWTGARPQLWTSSDEVRRGFCPTCGSVISFERPVRGRVAVTAGSLDDPGLLDPTEHMFKSQQCPWLRLDDGLPGYLRFPPLLSDIEPA